MNRGHFNTLFRMPAAAAAAAVVLAGCGGAAKSGAPPATAAKSGGATSTSAAGGGATTAAAPSAPGALQAEANAAAAGDIPDNQVFLTFRNPSVHYSMRYPEGWAQQGRGAAVTFRDKNNIVRIVVAAGGTPTVAGVKHELSQLHGVRLQARPHTVAISGRPSIATVYSTLSAPNSVTGRRVKLVVDRYYIWGHGRRAVVDLGTPVGVDNVDAYRMMIESFRWR